jgi:multiple sugar transport system permease protein
MRRTWPQSAALYATVLMTLGLILFPVYWLFVTALSTSAELSGLPPSFWPDDAQWEVFARVWEERPDPHLARQLAPRRARVGGAVDGRLGLRGLRAVALLDARRVHDGPLHPDRQDAAGHAPRHPALLDLPLLRDDRQPLDADHRPFHADHPLRDLDAEGLFRHHPARTGTGGDGGRLLALGAAVRVVLPIATPGLAATALYAFVLSWADYAYARTFLVNAQGNWTANLGITTMQGEYTTDWNEISAAAVFVAVPIIVIYLFLERYLVGGLTAGAEK